MNALVRFHDEPCIALPRTTIHLLGAFRVIAPDGSDVTPRGRKARAIIACVASTPAVPVKRRHLMRLLWSDRAPFQASTSLRQSLFEARTALRAAHADVLRPGRLTIGIVASRCRIDLHEPRLAGVEANSVEPFADLDGCDEAFDAWLANERAAWKSRIGI